MAGNQPFSQPLRVGDPLANDQDPFAPAPARRMRHGDRPAGPLTFEDTPAPSTSSVPMTMRQYFAAHAPHPVPDWFKFRDREPMPIEPEIPTTWTTAQRDEFVRLKNGEVKEFATDPAVAEFYRPWSQARGDMNAWRDRQRAAKFFAWRWYYADMMVAGATPSEIQQEMKSWAP